LSEFSLRFPPRNDCAPKAAATNASPIGGRRCNETILVIAYRRHPEGDGQ